MSRHGRGHGSPRKKMREFQQKMRRQDDERQSRAVRQKRQQEQLREAQE